MYRSFQCYVICVDLLFITSVVTVARLPQRQLGFLVYIFKWLCKWWLHSTLQFPITHVTLSFAYCFSFSFSLCITNAQITISSQFQKNTSQIVTYCSRVHHCSRGSYRGHYTDMTDICIHQSDTGNVMMSRFLQNTKTSSILSSSSPTAHYHHHHRMKQYIKYSH